LDGGFYTLKKVDQEELLRISWCNMQNGLASQPVRQIG
jgi:hypothetical protein